MTRKETTPVICNCNPGGAAGCHREECLCPCHPAKSASLVARQYDPDQMRAAAERHWDDTGHTSVIDGQHVPPQYAECTEDGCGWRAVAEPEEYTVEEVTEAAIPAKCPKCRRVFLGADAIRAPSLSNCACSYCGTRLQLHPKHVGFKDAMTRRRERECPLFKDLP